MSGVEQGRLENGISFEVMGLIVGKPEGDTLIVMDAYPLPVKGAENTVVADAPEVQEYMVSLSDALERARPERFCGWYHSHPFGTLNQSFCTIR
jgi:COP9 signalosome complex subunit 5